MKIDDLKTASGTTDEQPQMDQQIEPTETIDEDFKEYQILCGAQFSDIPSSILISLKLVYSNEQKFYVCKYNLADNTFLELIEAKNNERITSINMSFSRKFILMHTRTNLIEIYTTDLSV